VRRGPLVLGATAVGLVGVLGFRSHNTSAPISSATPSTSRTTSPSSGTSRVTGAAAGGNAATGKATSAGTTGSGVSSTTSPPPAAAPSTTTAPSLLSATGKTEQYGYGEIAVKVTVSGTRITGTSVPVIQTAEQYSQQLAAQVIPMLRGQVLSVQGSRIDGVSGATYTSEAYAMSVQSALDKLHFK